MKRPKNKPGRGSRRAETEALKQAASGKPRGRTRPPEIWSILTEQSGKAGTGPEQRDLALFAMAQLLLVEVSAKLDPEPEYDALQLAGAEQLRCAVDYLIRCGYGRPRWKEALRREIGKVPNAYKIEIERRYKAALKTSGSGRQAGDRVAAQVPSASFESAGRYPAHIIRKGNGEDALAKYRRQLRAEKAEARGLLSKLATDAGTGNTNTPADD